MIDSPAFFKDNQITACLSVCDASPTERVELELRLHIDLMDIPSANLSQHFEHIVIFLHEAQLEGHTTYVHCAAGISRSTTSVFAQTCANKMVIGLLLLPPIPSSLPFFHFSLTLSAVFLFTLLG